MNTEVEFSEIVQVGDVFLIRLKCPNCKYQIFTDYNNISCRKCDFDFSDALFYCKKKKQLRLISGTQRKSGLVTKKMVRTLRENQENHCAYCWCSLEHVEYHVDHIVPISFGGTNNLSNLVLSCHICNQIASNFIFNTLYAKQQYIMKKRRRNTKESIFKPYTE